MAKGIDYAGRSKIDFKSRIVHRRGVSKWW